MPHVLNFNNVRAAEVKKKCVFSQVILLFGIAASERSHATKKLWNVFLSIKDADVVAPDLKTQ